MKLIPNCLLVAYRAHQYRSMVRRQREATAAAAVHEKLARLHRVKAQLLGEGMATIYQPKVFTVYKRDGFTVIQPTAFKQ